MIEKKSIGVNHSLDKLDVIFDKDGDILGEIVNRLCVYMLKRELYVFGKSIRHINNLLNKIEIKKLADYTDSPTNSLCLWAVEKSSELLPIITWIEKQILSRDFLIYCNSLDKKLPEKIFGFPHTLEMWGDNGTLYLCGRTFSYHRIEIPDTFKVLAIIHCYNEADVIETTMNYLLDEGIDLYMLDNWSVDGTYELIKKLQNKFPDRIYLERFPKIRKEFFDLYHQLERTEQLARNLNYQWFIHYDADEIRISPWKNTTLRETIYQVDRLGYNAIDNTVINFKLTSDQNTNIFMKDVYFDFGHRETYFRQRKTWKKDTAIELKKSGGHEAVIPNLKIFPLKILTKHYPFRNMKQAQRKVFVDRKPRFKQEKEKFGWHGQYDHINSTPNFICDPLKLILWGQQTEQDLYIALFCGCGIFRTKDTDLEELVQLVKGKQIIIWGAGTMGARVYRNIFSKCKIIRWIDQNYKCIREKYFMPIEGIDQISNLNFDYCVIANSKFDQRENIESSLLTLGVSKAKILYYPKE